MDWSLFQNLTLPNKRRALAWQWKLRALDVHNLHDIRVTETCPVLRPVLLALLSNECAYRNRSYTRGAWSE